MAQSLSLFKYVVVTGDDMTSYNGCRSNSMAVCLVSYQIKNYELNII